MSVTLRRNKIAQNNTGRKVILINKNKNLIKRRKKSVTIRHALFNINAEKR